ncbi:MAG TPA: glycosyltransferase, partial [Ruania sp.]|nr:glycosyltransferase [Ruania sp.]
MTAHEGHVRAVLVGSTSSPYLSTTLAALAAQTRQAGEVIIASLDAQSSATDQRWQELLTESGLDPAAVRIVPVPHAATFGGAVRRALRSLDGETPPSAPEGQRRWLWLLHDDSAPHHQGLEYLLGAVDVSNAIAVAGAKQVEWDDPDRLISVGVRATRWGRRFTGIEDAEIDQGQHDGTDDVLAVGTAGMLIDAAVWHELGGPDPALGPFEDGRDISQRARLAGHRVVVVPRARVRHARARYRGFRARHSTAAESGISDSRTSFRQRREAILRLRLTSASAAALPLLAVVAVLASLGRALWRVAAKELGLALDELVAPWRVLARPRLLLRARRRARHTRRMPTRRLRPLQATTGEVARVRRDRRLQAAAARRAARTPSELEMRERAAVARKRRILLAAILLGTLALSALTIAPVAFSGSLIGGALLPSDATFVDLWHAANSTWINSGDGFSGPPDPFLFVLVVLSALTGGPLGVPVQITIALVLVLAMPLAALTGWLAAGAATRSLMLRAWAGLVWALGPALLLGIGAGRLGPIVAHVLLPLVLLGIVRSLGLDRRDVVISGMVGARRVSRRTSRRAGRSPGAIKRARLAALGRSGRTGADTAASAEESSSAASAQEAAGDEESTSVPASATPSSPEAAQPEEATPSDDAASHEAQPAAAATTSAETTSPKTTSPKQASPEQASPEEAASTAANSPETASPEEAPAQQRTTVTAAAAVRPTGPDWSGLDPIRSNTQSPTEPEPEESGAAVVSRVSHAPSLGAAAAAGLALAGAAAGAPVLLPAAVLALVLLAIGLGRRRSLPASRSRLVLAALPALVLIAPLLLFAASHDQGWHVLFAGPGAPLATEAGTSWLQLLAWPQRPAPGGVLPEPVGTWAPLAATGAVLLAALVALLRGAGRIRTVRLGWIVALVGLATALISTRVGVAVGPGADGTPQLVHGWAGPGTSLVLAGLLVAALTGTDGLRGTISRANFGWRQVTAVAGTVLVVLTIATSAVG